MSDQLELALEAVDYTEEPRGSGASCGDCAHCDEGRPRSSWREPSYCQTLRRQVSRSTGLCGRFTSKTAD